jgi:hypothetical protein
VLRLTGSDRAVAEVAAVAEHVASLTAAAAALRLDTGDAGRANGPESAPAMQLPELSGAGDAQAVLEEIGEWGREALDSAEVPAFWRALAHQPKLLGATWRKDRVVMAAGALDAEIKIYAAFAVASFRQNDYWVRYFTRLLRSAVGLDDAMLVELAGAVMHYVSFNTIAHGMRLDAPVAGITASDVAPGGGLEHLVPGVKRKVTPPKSSET